WRLRGDQPRPGEAWLDGGDLRLRRAGPECDSGGGALGRGENRRGRHLRQQAGGGAGVRRHPRRQLHQGGPGRAGPGDLRSGWGWRISTRPTTRSSGARSVAASCSTAESVSAAPGSVQQRGWGSAGAVRSRRATPMANAASKAELYALVDAIPESEYLAAVRFL